LRQCFFLEPLEIFPAKAGPFEGLQDLVAVAWEGTIGRRQRGRKDSRGVTFSGTHLDGKGRKQTEIEGAPARGPE